MIKKIKEKIQCKEEFSCRFESGYLLISNKEKFQTLFKKETYTEKDIIDMLISLHLILEIGLNIFFRHYFLFNTKTLGVSNMEIIEKLDEIGFKDKVAMFIYGNTFDFKTIKKEELKKYHKIIGIIKDFSECRNKLLHGHSIGFIIGNKKQETKTQKKINNDNLIKQIIKFQDILDGVAFYFRHSKSNINKAAKERFIESYLSHGFIDEKKFETLKEKICK